MLTALAWLKAIKEFFASLTPVNVAVMVLLCIAFGATGYFKGVSAEKGRVAAATAAAKAKEVVRQDSANDQAKAQASAAIDALQAEITRLNAQLEDNENEARNDPAAAQCGLPASGVLRLNRIR